MPQIIQRIDNLGRREATTLAASTTQLVFASVSQAAPENRQAVNLNNCDSSSDLYVRMVAAGSASPTVSSTDNDLIIPPKGSRQLQVGTAIDIYVRQSGASTINYTASEMR